MPEFLGGAVLGFIAANLLNFVELGILLKVMKDIKRMLKQFKLEGRDDKWLK